MAEKHRIIDAWGPVGPSAIPTPSPHTTQEQRYALWVRQAWGEPAA